MRVRFDMIVWSAVLPLKYLLPDDPWLRSGRLPSSGSSMCAIVRDSMCVSTSPEPGTAFISSKLFVGTAAEAAHVNFHASRFSATQLVSPSLARPPADHQRSGNHVQAPQLPVYRVPVKRSRCQIDPNQASAISRFARAPPRGIGASSPEVWTILWYRVVLAAHQPDSRRFVTPQIPHPIVAPRPRHPY
jgi:hypothetical protein